MTATLLDRPATVETVRARIDAAAGRVFATVTAASQRDHHSFTGSCVGGCRRQAAYKLGRTPISDDPDPGEGRASVLGTWMHEHFLPLYAAELGDGAEYEQPVTLRAAGLEVGGQLDVWVAPEVHDLKTVADRRLHGLRRNGGPYADHKLQIDSYALAKYQAGHDVEHVAWLYLHRERGELQTVVEPFTNASVVSVVDRMTEIKHYADTSPDQAPQDGRGPGLSLACDSCPWLRRCWGDDAIPGQIGAQANRVKTDADREAALLGLDDASRRRSEGDADYKLYKALLGRTRPGIYGSMSLRLGRPGEETDHAAMTAKYAEMGWELPKKPRARRLLYRPEELLTKKMRQEIASYTVPDDAGDTD